MSLAGIIAALIVLGVLPWLVNTYTPMDGKIKKILNLVVVLAVGVGALPGQAENAAAVNEVLRLKNAASPRRPSSFSSRAITSTMIFPPRTSSACARRAFRLPW
jgi:hypothetical protein